MTDMLFKELETEWRETAGTVPLRHQPESPMWIYEEDGSSQCRLCHKSMSNNAFQFWNRATSKEHRRYCCNSDCIDEEAVAYEKDWFNRVTDQCNQFDHLLAERMEPEAAEPGSKTPRRFESAPTKPSLNEARRLKKDSLPDVSTGSAEAEPRRATLGQRSSMLDAGAGVQSRPLRRPMRRFRPRRGGAALFPRPRTRPRIVRTSDGCQAAWRLGPRGIRRHRQHLSQFAFRHR